MKASIFGAYDIRGKYPSEINEKVVSELLPSILKTLGGKKKGKVIVGYDARLSSPNLYRAALRELDSLKKSGYDLEVVPAGMITTPMIYFLVGKFKAKGGIVITASHNPKEYNGMKVVNSTLLPVSGTEIYELYKTLR
jgi:phosphomannomutase